jgi:transaldolase
MQLFIDSADPKQIKTALSWGIIDGVTTNPSLAARVGRPYKEIVAEILEMVPGDVSLEVIATDYETMLEQAHKLSTLSSKVVVKIPCTQDGLRVCKKLITAGIKTNVTLIFSANQALLVGKLGATYCSPFIGRLDDIADHSGDDLVADMRRIFDRFDFKTKILAASIRDTGHVERVAGIGADVATLPFNILGQLVRHPLTEKGLNKFLYDWKEAGLKFPV